MGLTIEKPETEARFIRFATARGLTPAEALDEAELPLDTIPEILIRAEPDVLKKAMDELDAGLGIPGDEFLAELRRPLD